MFGPVDFALHLTGRSGTFKSELISLFQSHYGDKMDARNLPGSWSSTGNALEAQSFYAANAPFVIDDFVPIGTSWQIKAYQTTADKIIRAQGNQSGRARLTDTSSLQSAYYPRGVILSTGEDTPEGHSVRARMMIMELSPGDVAPDKLTKAQHYRPNYSIAVAALIRHLCTHPIDLRSRSDAIRNKCLSIGHTRTPPMLGRLVATAEVVLHWAFERHYISENARARFTKLATESIMDAGKRQQQYLESTDPVELFSAAIRQAFGAGLAHMRTLNGGIPAKPTMLGWTEDKDHNDFPIYKSHGPCVGWVNWNNDEMFLEINVGYNAIRKIAGHEMALTKQTMFKRLKDAGALLRTDEVRQRNTVRITAENHPRQVVALSIAGILETQEGVDDPAPGREPGCEPPEH